MSSKIARALLAFILIYSTSPAWITGIWDIDGIEKSPALVVATVDRTDRQEPASEPNTYYWLAKLHVLRATGSNAPLPGTDIAIRYISTANNVGPAMTYIYVSLVPGTTALFPLRLAKNSAETWELEGSSDRVSVPALVSAPVVEHPPLTPRQFIINEFVNAIALGGDAERKAAGRFLIEGFRSGADLLSALEQAVGKDEDRWLDIVIGLRLGFGLPQKSTTDLLNGPPPPRVGDQVVAMALQRGALRNSPYRYLTRLVTKIGVEDDEWALTNLLLEFKESPIVTEEIREALRRDPASAIYAAHVFSERGQTSLLPQALAAAIAVVQKPVKVNLNRVRAAQLLLQNFGNDAQFQVLLATIRRLKISDEAGYRVLIYSVDTGNRRGLQIAAIYLDDTRGLGASSRYCDAAANIISRISHENFTADMNAPLAERNERVVQAAAWLQAHGQ